MDILNCAIRLRDSATHKFKKSQYTNRHPDRMKYSDLVKSLLRVRRFPLSTKFGTGCATRFR